MKTLACRDVGVNCDFKIKGRTEDEVLRKAEEHARKDHNITQVTSQYRDAWRKKIHEE